MLALIYSVFGALCGWLEAVLYSTRAAEAFGGNEHGGMMMQRIAAWLLVPATVLLYHWYGLWVLAEAVPAALLFPMVHDEAYNFTRLWIACRSGMAADYEKADRLAWITARDLYVYGYQSPTTTARNDFDGPTRTRLAILGGLVLAALYVFPFLPFSLF
jgi:pimeloyl-ACP methyl ester carboxylesterase